MAVVVELAAELAAWRNVARGWFMLLILCTCWLLMGRWIYWWWLWCFRLCNGVKGVLLHKRTGRVGARTFWGCMGSLFLLLLRLPLLLRLRFHNHHLVFVFCLLFGGGCRDFPFWDISLVCEEGEGDEGENEVVNLVGERLNNCVCNDGCHQPGVAMKVQTWHCPKPLY